MDTLRQLSRDQRSELAEVRALATKRPPWPVVVYITLATTVIGVLGTALLSLPK